MKQSFTLLAIAIFGLILLPGCGGEENQVIQPTATYQPTAEEQANAQASAAAEEEAKSDNSGFSN